MLPVRLKSTRKNRKITQGELAKLVNTSKATISNYENDYSSPSNDMLVRIANVLNVTTDYLLGRTDDPDENLDFYQSDFAKDYGFTPPSDEDERVFFQDFHKMTKEEKEEAIRYIKIQREMRKKEEENN